jgi:hypothetical protein
MKLNKPQISDVWFKLGEWVKAHVVIFVYMYTNAVANMLRYSYKYDMIFIPQFLKLNINYIQPQGQSSTEIQGVYLYPSTQFWENSQGRSDVNVQLQSMMTIKCVWYVCQNKMRNH